MPARRWSDLARSVMTRCDALARHSEDADGLTRTFLRDAMRGAHEEVGGWMRAAGLAVRVDAAGSLRGRRESAPPGGPTLLIGSHLDTVRNAGRYDGALGVLAGIAVAETLADTPLPFALEVVGFSDEEGVRFGTPYLGSRALAGRFDPSLLELRDADGVSLREAIAAFGLDPAELPGVARPATGLLGYLELHIEQGPVLEAADLPLGVVDAVVGQSRRAFVLRGRAGHAGTTPMALRRDALAGAAALVSEIERYARGVDGLVATVGTLAVRPGASNVIPGEVELSLDVRHRDDAVRHEAVVALEAVAARLAAARRLDLETATLHDADTETLDAGFRDRLSALTGAPQMTSGAGHDAAVMQATTRSALLFVRSPGGLSHHPDESVLDTDLAVALEAMVGFVTSLAVSPPGPPAATDPTSHART